MSTAVPRASATVLATKFRSSSEARSTKTGTVPGTSARMWWAAATATAVFPTPPGPASVTRRCTARHSDAAEISAARPMMLPGNRGSGDDTAGAAACFPAGLPPGARAREAVAASWYVRDVVRIGRVRGECLPELADLETQVALLDLRAGPGLGGQLTVADDLPGPGNEVDQEVQGTTADPDG